MRLRLVARGSFPLFLQSGTPCSPRPPTQGTLTATRERTCRLFMPRCCRNDPRRRGPSNSTFILLQFRRLGRQHGPQWAKIKVSAGWEVLGKNLFPCLPSSRGRMPSTHRAGNAASLEPFLHSHALLCHSRSCTAASPLSQPREVLCF